MEGEEEEEEEGKGERCGDADAHSPPAPFLASRLPRQHGAAGEAGAAFSMAYREDVAVSAASSSPGTAAAAVAGTEGAAAGGVGEGGGAAGATVGQEAATATAETAAATPPLAAAAEAPETRAQALSAAGIAPPGREGLHWSDDERRHRSDALSVFQKPSRGPAAFSSSAGGVTSGGGGGGGGGNSGGGDGGLESQSKSAGVPTSATGTDVPGRVHGDGDFPSLFLDLEGAGSGQQQGIRPAGGDGGGGLGETLASTVDAGRQGGMGFGQVVGSGGRLQPEEVRDHTRGTGGENGIKHLVHYSSVFTRV